MKKTYLILLFCIFAVISNAQTYQISFFGSGASENLENVEIYNLTQGTSIVVDGSDIVNFEVGQTSIYNNIVKQNGIIVYPNPMNQSCNLEFFQNSNGLCQVLIVDVLGTILYSTKKELLCGIQNYQISGLGMGLYFIQINTPENHYSVKVVSNNSNRSQVAVKYISSNDIGLKKDILKNSKNEIEMQYLLGDLVLFKGTSGNYSTIIVTEIDEDMNINFEFVPCTDADNNHYAVVKIDDRIWMYENLATTTYNNTTPIPNITESANWDEQTTGAYVLYDNNIENKDMYGALYNWYAVESQQLCPEGWSVPTETDWTELVDIIGGVLVAGGKLKQTTTDYWLDPNTGATNEYGFSALPGGERSNNGVFSNLNTNGSWWTSSEEDLENAVYNKMFYNLENVEQNSINKTNGFSIRCVLNCDNPTITMVENANICEDIESFFVDVDAENYSSLNWTTNGDGTFSDNSELNPIYYFGANDYSAGNVSLTLTANPLQNCASSVSKSISISLSPLPEIEIYTDDTVCYGPLTSQLGLYVWLNAVATYYEDTEWICTNCDGEIDYDTEVIPIYLPTEMDYAVGYNDFIFKVHSLSPCNKIISEKVRVYYLKPDADAGPDQDIYGHIETYLTANAPTAGQSGWWSVVSDNGNEDNFEDYHDNLTKFTGEVGETYILTWTINDHDCWNVDSVEVNFKTIYGDPCPGTSTCTDSRDGQTYNTVQIGTQCWMAENLNYNTAGSECFLFEEINCNAYGRLYNWEIAMNGEESTTANPSEVQGVCPDGWHFPSFDEYHQLGQGLGHNDVTYGVMLKSEAWDGTNESGFSALPGGFKYYAFEPDEDDFWNLGLKGYWWSSTEVIAYPDEAYFFMMQSSYDVFYNSNATKLDKRSIRCVKDIDIPQVSTFLCDKVRYNSARSGGVIHNEGASAVTTKGIVWSTSQEPTIDNNIGLLEDDSDENSYLSVITDLLPETTYYARAFATNTHGTGYGQDVTFTTTSDEIPVVDYHSVFDIRSTKAKSGGTISNEGGDVITQYGLVWSTNPNVDMDNYEGITAANEIPNIFDTTMTGLIPLTTYYVKAYAISSLGIGYGNEVSFTTLEPGDGEHCMGISSFIDPRDGNEYGVVSIGTRCWIAENMKYLPEVHHFRYNNDTDPRYYVIGYHAEEPNIEEAKSHPNYDNYGVIYNHSAAMDVCPSGWHLPTIGEWEDLVNYINDDFLGGDELKSCRTVNSTLGGDCNTNEHPRWNESLMPGFNQGSDDYGFSALPGGWILYEDDAWGYEINPGNEAIWWSLSFDTPQFYNKIFRLDVNNTGFRFDTSRDNRGFSVRCVKD